MNTSFFQPFIWLKTEFLLTLKELASCWVYNVKAVITPGSLLLAFVSSNFARAKPKENYEVIQTCFTAKVFAHLLNLCMIRKLEGGK